MMGKRLVQMDVGLCRKPLAVVIAALVSSLIILSSPGLLVGFIASFALVCVLPGCALMHLLRSKLGSLNIAEKTIVTAGSGYLLLIPMALTLVYLPIPFTRGNLLLSSGLLILALLGLSLWKGGGTGSPARISRAALFGFLLTAVVASLLRFPHLGHSEFMGDEAKVLLWATEVIEGNGDVILLYRKGPAEILVSATFYALLGRTNELVARLPFTIANLAAMLTIFQLGCSMFGVHVGLVAGLLAAVEGFFVGLARVVQYQSLVLLLGCFSVWCFYRFCRGSVQAWPLLGAISLAVGFLCHWDMIFVVPVVAYLSLEALLRHGDGIWKHRNWPIGGALLAIALCTGFFLPYLFSPQFEETFEYLAKRVRATRLPYFHLQSFYDYGTAYNSTYYSLFMSLAVLLESVHIVARSLQHKELPAVVRVGIVLVVPASLLIWIGPDRPSRIALMAGVLAALILVLLSKRRLEVKALCLWFFIPLIAYTFVVRLPLLHIYNISSAVSLLAGSALIRSLNLLKSFRQRRIATTGLVCGYILFANYARMAFVQTEPEYQRTYPEHRSPIYWAPYGDAFPKVNAFGFPHAAGWKTVGSLYQIGVLSGDYDSNEKGTVTQWYTRSQVRCKFEPRYYFIAEDVLNVQPVPMKTIEEQYRLVATVSTNDQVTLRIHERLPTTRDGVVHYRLGDWIADFDNKVSKATLFTGVPQVDPEADIRHPLDVRFGDGLRLLGHELERSHYQPGDHVVLVLYWQMLEPLASGHRIYVHLGQGDDRWAQKDVPPGCGLLRDDDWIAGGVMTDRYSLWIDPASPSGWYSLRVGMYRLAPMDEERRVVPAFDQHGDRLLRDEVLLTKLQVGEPDSQRHIQHPLKFQMGDSISLLGYDLAETEVAPASQVELTLYWQAREDIGTSYTVFTHLVDVNDQIRGQWDSIPDRGRNPTDEWVPGEIVIDSYDIPVSAEAEQGQYIVRVGMYDLATQRRLAVSDTKGNRLGEGYAPLDSVFVRTE
jgi:hypothetical protein